MHPPVAVAAAAVFARFTSLGDGCEFGLAQRRAGAEPLGLLRFAAAPLPALCAALADNVAALDPPTSLAIARPWGQDHIARWGDGFFHHTFRDDLDPPALHAREAARLPYLRRRLLEQLAGAETLFVRAADAPDPAGMHALHRALRRHNPANRLLWVEPAAAGHATAAASVIPMAPGLLRGTLARRAPLGHAAELCFDGWLGLCAAALHAWGEPAPPAHPPTSIRIGIDAPMGGWDGVTCTPGAPIPPLLPHEPVWTHATDAARTCCGAVLNPRPAPTPGTTLTASVYVWVPPDFTGSLIAPVLTHVPAIRSFPAVLADRGCWQRLWVSTLIPACVAGIDFALWVDLAPGDWFYSTEWVLAPGNTPGDYWLQPQDG